MFADRLRRAILFSVVLGVRINLPADVSVATSQEYQHLKAGTELGDLAVHYLASTDPECMRVCSCRHTSVSVCTFIAERVPNPLALYFPARVPSECRGIVACSPVHCFSCWHREVW